MVAKEVFVYYHNFNPIWLQHASIHVKKYWHSSQKRYCQGFRAGAGARVAIRI
jgi:hypothetical protein